MRQMLPFRRLLWSCMLQRARRILPCMRKIQPLPPRDYFSYFGLPRKLWIDMAGLEQKILRAQLETASRIILHNTHRAEREMSLRARSKLNDAYRVLRDPVARVEYLLELEGMRKEGEPSSRLRPNCWKRYSSSTNRSTNCAKRRIGWRKSRRAFRTRLRAREKNFGEKLHEVDAELKTAAQQWDAALDANASDADREAICSA